MTRERFGIALLCITLVAVGAWGWALQMQPDLRVDASELAQLPDRIGAWRSQEVPLEDTVEAVLQADFNLQRVYRRPSGEFLWLYIGYYGTARGGRPEHTPRGCYTGAGWSIEDSDVLEVDAAQRLRVNEYIVAQDGQRRLVHFWYRSHRRTGMVGGLDQNLDRLVGRLLDRRADGALIRVSAPIRDGDRISTRSRLMAFAAALDPLVESRWPREVPEARE